VRYILKKLNDRYTSLLKTVRKRNSNQMQIQVTYSDGRIVQGTTNRFETYDDLDKFIASGPSIVTIPTTTGGILVDINNVNSIESRFYDTQSYTTVYSKDSTPSPTKDVIVSDLDLSKLTKKSQEGEMADAKKADVVVTDEPKVTASQTLPDELIERTMKDFTSFRDNFLKRADVQKPSMDSVIAKLKKRGELINQADKMLDGHISDLENMIKSGE
jgi:hypothetical protein